MIAQAFAVALFFSSLALMRRNHFTAFFVLHFAFLGFYLFGLLHSREMFVYALIAGGLYAVDVVLRLLAGWPSRALGMIPAKTPRLTAVLESVDGGLVRLRAAKPWGAHLTGDPNLTRSQASAGLPVSLCL